MFVQEEIKSGKYVTKDEYDALKEAEVKAALEPKNDILVNSETNLEFEKPEKYTARKNDISLYDTYETPIEYITRETKQENDLEITPFSNDDKVVEHVVVKDEVSKEDIAKAITELDVYELELLKSKISDLVDIKKDDLLLKIKDAA